LLPLRGETFVLFSISVELTLTTWLLF